MSGKRTPRRSITDAVRSCFAPGAGVWRRVRRWWHSVDPYVVRGVPQAYRKGMVLFWWYGVFISMASAFVDPYVTLYALAMGATRLQVGSLASAASFFGMLMPIPGARWAARLGRRKPVVLISFGLRFVALLVALLAPLLTTGQVLVLLIMAAFAARAAFLHLGTSPWTSMAGDLVPQERRGRYFAARKTVMALASLICVPLAGQLIGLFPDPVGYQVAFALAVLWGAVALYLFGRVPERGVSGPQRRAQRTDQEASLWRVLRGNDLFWRFVLISMGFNFFWQLGGPYFGVYQVEVLGATASVVGWLSMVSAAMRMIGQQVWGRAVDRRGARWALTLCHLLIPFLPFIWLPLRAPWQLVFVVVPSGFLWAGREIANFNLLLELVGEERQTDMIAGYNTLIAVANILGPLVGGQVIRLWGYRADFVLSGIGRMVAALLFLGLLRPFRGRVWTLLAPDRRGS